MVRLVDIARQAGVSVMTVSRVLRDAPDIAASTKARVQSIAQQLGYVPDVMAQAMRTRNTRLLAIVAPDTSDPVTSRIVLALAERAHDLGYDLLVSQSRHQIDREEACLRRVLARRVEGLFLCPIPRLDPSAPIYLELKQRGVRVVALGPKPPFCEPFVSVQADDALASSKVTRHLLALGHRRIAFLAGPSTSPAAQSRFEGYRRALREAGLETDDRLVFRAGETVEEGARATVQLIDERATATAIQAVSDLVAMGAARVLLDQGLRLPHDVSLAGYGNIPFSEVFRVPLTTVRQPKYQLGLAAMTCMQALLLGAPASSHQLPAELVIRASTGPAPPGDVSTARCHG